MHNKKPVKEEDGNDYLIPDNEFRIGDWHFRVIEADDPYETYPNYIRMIANHDQKYRIAYHYFSNSHLDYISENKSVHAMKEFINEYFHYNFRNK